MKPFVEWYVKITLEDERAENVDNNAYLEYFFTLQLRDRCADDTLTLTTEIANFNYTLGGSTPVTLAYTQTYSGLCTTTATI